MGQESKGVKLLDKTSALGQSFFGRCAIFPWQGPGSWELGITIHRPHLGNGYAEEVLRRIFDYAFKDLGAKEILFRTEPENHQMLRQYEKLGIPKVLDAQNDTPEPPLFHKYHRFVLTERQWKERPQK